MRGCNMPAGNEVPALYTYTSFASIGCPVFGSTLSKTLSGLFQPNKNGSSKLNPVSWPAVNCLSRPTSVDTTAAKSNDGSNNVMHIEPPRQIPNILAPNLYSLNAMFISQLTRQN